MNKKRIVKILGILLFVTLSFVLLSKPIIPVSEVYAVSCPSGMDEDSQECLDYLQDQYAKIQGQLSTLKKKLNNELSDEIISHFIDINISTSENSNIPYPVHFVT